MDALEWLRVSLATVLLGGGAVAGELHRIGSMAIPGKALTSFDIGFVDQTTGRYYLADRSNSGVDVFDTGTDRYIGRLGAFVGAIVKDGKVDNARSGPNGVLAIGDALWAGDGDSSLKIFDLATNATLATLATGGKTRLDEMALDPEDHVFIGVNNAEEPPFATLISTEPGHRVLGKIVLPEATDGAEQPAYNPDDGLLYVSIPEIDKDPRRGAVAVIDPRTAKRVRMLPVEGCHPTGLAFGPKQNFILGCNADGKRMPAVTVVMNARSGTVVATIPGLGGTDMVNYNDRNGQYYTASARNPGGPTLGIIDARTNTLVQTLPIAGGTPHSVASSEASGHVYVPVGTTDEREGAIDVYAPAP